ncbi:hypothetical protein K9M59_01640 [Candidatus Gracilibacteria bacterium]|nr:hypothetical protein [Candidatus Gracilibacteria bacterium]MCF7819762.1 hypothetical protein [Candidatus Gracilibacteria bacterium]
MVEFLAVKPTQTTPMVHTPLFSRCRKYFTYFLLVGLFFNTAFAAVYDVTGISDKTAGGNLTLSDFNSIINTIKSFFRDDATGNVGIGVSSPGYPLAVKKDQDAGTYVSIENANIGSADIYSGMRMKIGSTTFPAYLRYSAKGGANFLELSNYESQGPIYFSSGSTDRAMTISAGGSVGIGITGPNAKLDVAGRVISQGDLRINGNGTSNNLGVMRFYTDAAGTVFVDANNDGADMVVKDDGNVGIGITSPTEALDVSGNIKASGTLEWGGGASIASSDLIETFPYDELVDHWDGTNKAFRYYVNGTSGSDSNTGASMSTAFQTVGAAIAKLPDNLNGYTAYIIIHPDTYNESYNFSRFSNGEIAFVPAQEFIDTGTGDFTAWVRNGESNVSTSDGQVIFTSSGTTISSWNDGDFLFYFVNRNHDVSWDTPGNWIYAPFKLTSTCTDCPIVQTGNLNSPNYEGSFELDLANAGMGWLIGKGGKIRFNGVKVTGGSGNASTSTSAHRGVFLGANTTPDTSITIHKIGISSSGWMSGHAPGGNTRVWQVTGVRQLFNFRDPVDVQLTLDSSAMDYNQGSLPDGDLPTIRLGSSITGNFAYHSDYQQMNDASTEIHAITDNKDSSTKKYLSSTDLLTSGGNVGIGITSPTEALDVAGNIASTGTICDGAGNCLDTLEGTGQWTASGSDISYSAGNVGIGTTSPSEKLEVNNTIVFTSQYDNGNSGTSKTIDWGNGNKQKLTLTGNATLTFTDPGGAGNFTLVLAQDATGSRTITWPASVKWPNGGTAPTLTTAASAIDIISCYFDGSATYFCTPSFDFQ